MSDLFIGQLIKQKIKEQGIRISDFAKAIHCSRPNVYDIFERSNINFEQLVLISSVLNYDFVSELYAKKENNLQGRYIVILEMNGIKFQELLADTSVQIIISWEVSK
jgi:hypothetical protein